MANITIQSVHCYSFDLALVHPFFARSQEITRRQGMIVHVISDHGQMGFGEVAPLPGVSHELLKKAVHQTEIIARELKNAAAPLEAPLLLAWLSARMPPADVCPSVRFGISSAILCMAARFQNRSVQQFLKPGIAPLVHSAGLLQGTVPDLLRQARFLAAKGYTTFKMKVGSRNIPIDVQKVTELRRVIGPEARLRLDANRAWRLDEALVFAQNIGKDRIEYIEEPVADPRQIEAFYRATDMPVALDETLNDMPLEDLAGRAGIVAAVARPMTMGVDGYLEFLQEASRLGVAVVTAAAFESGVGMTMLANLAALTHGVADLGTANWFDQDLLLRPVVVDRGEVPADRFTLETQFFHEVFIQQLKVV